MPMVIVKVFHDVKLYHLGVKEKELDSLQFRIMRLPTRDTDVIMKSDAYQTLPDNFKNYKSIKRIIL